MDTVAQKSASDNPDNSWDVVEIEVEGKSWEDQSTQERLRNTLIVLLKIALAIFLLYGFIVSLGCMGAAFVLLGGKTSGAAFRNNELFDNPIAGLVIGILATVLVQSSSTSTSIIITMTAAGLMKLQNAIYMIMGANIGTSVTNTIVSLTHIGDKNQYRRAFAGATVHDCFNLLSVLLLLPLEAIFGILRHLSTALVDDAFGISADTEKQDKVDFLKKITKPISKLIVQVDKKLITKIAQEDDMDVLAKYEKQSILVHSKNKGNFIFKNTAMSDSAAGWVLLFVSLLAMCICLVVLVKTLQSILRGRVAVFLRSTLNLETKFFPPLANYILILAGGFITILFQSSSVTTSTLTPLVGIGIIRLDKMFAFTVGANIGTTVTGILAALASSNIQIGLKVALAHLAFNLFGTALWYPIPMMRAMPLGMAKLLGYLAAELRWFPPAYLIVMFGLVPALLLGLSIASPWALVAVGGPLFIMTMCLAVVIYLRLHNPDRLPAKLKQDPAWLPIVLRVEKPDVEEQSTATEMDYAEKDIVRNEVPVWGLEKVSNLGAWVLLMFLLVSLPNNQWANLNYTKFDGRPSLGIGAWSVCSGLFTDEQAWAPRPNFTACTESELAKCFNTSAAFEGCTLNSAFSDDLGANEKYEGAWKKCRGDCRMRFEDYCVSMGCGGSMHEMQCRNITESVGLKKMVSYSYPADTAAADSAWKEGDRCRPVSEVCSNSGSLATAGGCGVAGGVFATLGLFFLVSCSYIRNYGGVKDLIVSVLLACASFGISSLLLFISWVVFAAASGANTECTVPDMGGSGVVRVKGSFVEIINGRGSYTFAFIIVCWLLASSLTICTSHRLWKLREHRAGLAKMGKVSGGKGSENDTTTGSTCV